MGKLEGKVAVVTGGARAMGAATSRLFVAEGAWVVIADVLDAEGKELARELGDAAVFHHLDVSDEAGWADLAALCRDRFGGVDVLVNNAGVITFAALEDTSLADFQRVLAVNVGGCFLGMRTLAPMMMGAGGGAIVNISSIDGMKGANSLGAYAASKWAVRGLTKVAALEFGHRGVRVNSVHPGGIDTPMGNPQGKPAEEMNKLFYRGVPLQRMGTSEEVARVSLFLASSDSSYMNGAELAVDGGWTAGHYYAGYPGAPT
ncbi:MAG TPA: glucose 1-dehydrogenase [Acetobacteraceae bacterium]|nr:glucose 1-dehydrogenase [Acetobacteraceae bacterium]